MTPVVLALPDSEAIGARLSDHLDGEPGGFEHRHFPDGESYIRVTSDVAGRAVVLCSTLHQPDAKLLPLYFLAGTCRALGASSVGLVAPYLAYMRQDRQFQSGEAVTSIQFATLISSTVDWLVTMDPHLHRIHDLNDLYTIPSRVVHAAPSVARWIRENVEHPVLVGPDEESEQWVSAIASDAGAPWMVLEKIRHGDREVTISAPNVAEWTEHTPVLVDDIISTARTMMETIKCLLAAGMKNPVCVGVHAVFAGDAFAGLQASGTSRIVTCNTIPHESNGIDVMPSLADAARKFL